MKPLHIVIVAYQWPPMNSIATHRPYAWAKHWSEAGARITVLTAQKTVFDGPLDLEAPGLENVGVIEVPYLKGASYILKNSSGYWLIKKAKQLKYFLSQYGVASGSSRSLWRKAAQPFALQLAKEADVVVTTFNPDAAHLIGYDMKSFNPNLLWIADYRDLWSLRHNLDAPKRTRATMRKTELATVGEKADIALTVSEDLTQQLAHFLKKEAHCVPNGFDADEEEVTQRLTNKQTQQPGTTRIVYTGVIYKNYRDPVPVLEAIVSLVSENKIRSDAVTVDFYGSHNEVAEELAKNTAYKPFIRLMGHVSRERAIRAQREAGLLLIMESPKAEARGVLTGKLFEYLVAGRPILCVGSLPEYEIGQLLKKTGTGRAFGPNDQAALKEIILETLEGRGLHESYSPKLEEILAYSRKRQALSLLNLITAKKISKTKP